MAGAAFLPEMVAHQFGRFGRQPPLMPSSPGSRATIAAPECTLGADERRQPGREMAAAEHLCRRQRVAALQQGARITPSSVWSSSAMMKLPQPLAHLGLDRRQPHQRSASFLAAHGELGLELRIVRLEAQLDVAAVLEDLHVGQHVVGARLADAEGMETLSRVMPVMPPSSASRGITCSSSMRRISRGTPGVKKKRGLADGDGEAAGPCRSGCR